MLLTTDKTRTSGQKILTGNQHPTDEGVIPETSQTNKTNMAGRLFFGMYVLRNNR